ncbi:hypothetical protein BT96DRAFT_923814 [Gymnopus androsaceus JB14]|uniref:Uncharacterized protein n=1 Tax=Gymnopus androsaceus JB14 TaxID=1447944 RepID=A0A6A4H9M5_9AGAR|nr:hypothetical protein BT96DRAFT_923814 [Gymnopus androsaceus JB14]
MNPLNVLPPAKRRKIMLATHAPPVARSLSPQIREELAQEQHQALSHEPETRTPEYLSPTPASESTPHPVIGIPSPERMKELAEYQSARIKSLENATRTPNVIPEYLEGLIGLLENMSMTFEEKADAADQLLVDAFARKWGDKKIDEFNEKIQMIQSGGQIQSRKMKLSSLLNPAEG